MSEHAQSKDSRSQVKGRLRLVTISILIAYALVLMTGDAKTRVPRYTAGGVSRIASPRSQSQPIDVRVFVAQGMPVQFAGAFAKNDKGSADLTYTLTNNSGASINGLDLTLFDFNPVGKLMGGESWSVQAKIEPGASQSFSLNLRRRVAPGDRLALCVETVRGDADAWQVDFNDLTQAIGASFAGAAATPPEVRQRAEKVPESFGGVYCSDAFAKAFRLAKSGDGKGLTAFACDRDQRFSAYRFSAKSLVK